MRRTCLGAAALLLSPAPLLAQHEGHGAPPRAPAGAPGQDQTKTVIASPDEGPEKQSTQPDAPPPATGHEGHDMGMEAPAAEASPDRAAMDHRAQGEGHFMSGALGPYPMTRESSGTAWQPDTSRHSGIEATAGTWNFMGHASLSLVYDWQGGPRGDDKAFVGGMIMGSAQRRWSNGNALQLRVGLSPEPFMGKRGYPLHLASGETADGVTTLVDRQHPHDLFMELSASYGVRLSDKASLFLYGGLPGEPAFGPPAFLHRMSALDSPEAPISHHWLDSTHISFGVITAGFVQGGVKIEASRFNGREPDHHRYDIETGPLDSTALRLSWNPANSLSLQASWARLKSPEQLEPGENQTRWSASAIYTRVVGRGGRWSTTLAWGRKSSGDESFDALLLESALSLRDWTLFGRAERTENDELLQAGGHHGPAFRVSKASLGLIRDFRLANNLKLGVGALYALSFVPSGLEPLYGGDPEGAMGFVRLKID